MGAVCCCLPDVDSEEHLHPNNSIYRNCMCLKCFIQPFVSVYAALFNRGGQVVYSSIQGVAPLSSPGQVTSLDTSVPDTYRSPPRPLPYEVDPRCSCSQRGPVSRREKSSSHFLEESQPLRRSDSNDAREALGTADKWNGTDCEGGSNDCFSEYPSIKVINSESFIVYPNEEDDVCPTCLEEYTTENPKIITKCSHHFHLGCIYEWKERSKTCPVCGQVMIFDETA